MISLFDYFTESRSKHKPREQINMKARVEVRGSGVKALRAFLAANLRPDQLQKAEVKRLVVAEDANALDTAGMRLAAALLSELRAGDPSVPSARSILQGGSARVVAVATSEGERDTEEADRKRAVYLEKRRKKLLRLDEEMRYGGMIRNVKTHSAPRELERHQTSVKQHLSIGANMVVARITAFVAVYMVARSLTDDETTVRCRAGLDMTRVHHDY